MSEIKPRVEDGVPWCDPGECNPTYFSARGEHGSTICIDGKRRYSFEVCPHAVRRMAVENEAWRSGRVELATVGGERVFLVFKNGGKGWYFDTIDDAVDELIAEREE